MFACKHSPHRDVNHSRSKSRTANVTQRNENVKIGIRPANPQLIFPAKFEVNWINNLSENVPKCTETARPITDDQKFIRTGQSQTGRGRIRPYWHSETKSVNTPLLFKRIWGKCYTHNVQLRVFYRYVFTKCTSNRRQTYVDSRIYYEITCRASRLIRTCKLELFQQNGRTYKFWPYVFSVFCKYLRGTIRCLVLIGSLYKVIPISVIAIVTLASLHHNNNILLG